MSTFSGIIMMFKVIPAVHAVGVTSLADGQDEWLHGTKFQFRAFKA